MKLYRSITILLATFFVMPSVFSQGADAEKAWEAIKKNSEYVHGEGLGNTIKEADNNALHDLLSKISLHVSSSFTSEETEITFNNNVDSRSAVNSLVASYTNGSLTNTEKLVISDEPNAIVGRYIRKTEIVKIFENRKKRISDMLDVAYKAEEKGRIDIALRNYYQAYMLTTSLQHPSTMRYVTAHDNVDHSVLTWVPEHINVIFDDTRVKVKKRQGDDVELEITYKGKPVSSLDFRYYDGREWTNVASAQDGVATMELAAGFKATAYKVALEFMYRDEALQDSELKGLVQLIKAPAALVQQSYINIKSEDDNTPDVKPQPVAKSSSSSGDNYVSEKSFSTSPSYALPTQTSDSSSYKKIVNNIVEVIKSKNYGDNRITGYFTEHGRYAYNTLINYGSACIIGAPSLQYYKFLGQTIVRGVKMQFKFQNGVRKSFVEDIVFTFDTSGKIDNVTFGLDKTATDDILGKSVWNTTTRYAIMQFLENYKTAFAMKNLQYIQGVFDKDATIITGYVTKKAINSAADNGGISLTKDQITYQKYNKEEYLAKLKKSFASKEFINIRFSNNEVIKLGKGQETFAIQIDQEYYSSNYNDKGYLMLFVDMNDPNAPLIKLRTWQPEMDTQFAEKFDPSIFK